MTTRLTKSRARKPLAECEGVSLSRRNRQEKDSKYVIMLYGPESDTGRATFYTLEMSEDVARRVRDWLNYTVPEKGELPK